MKILVTGAKGFVGRNLCENLKNLRDGKNRTRPALTVDEIYEYDIDTDPVLLEEYCAKADFVFNLAGVNRPKNEAEFMQGNFGFASTLLDMLKRHGNTCPAASRQRSSAATARAITAKANWRARNCSLLTPRRLAHRCWSTASRTCSANGAARIITAL